MVRASRITRVSAIFCSCIALVIAIGVSISGCHRTASSDTGQQIQAFCKLNPPLCTNGQLNVAPAIVGGVVLVTGVPPAHILLPDLYVRDVGCDAIGGDVWVGAHIGNQGPVELPTLAAAPTSPQQVDVLVTLNPGSDQVQKLRLNSLVPPPHGQGDQYHRIASLPNGDPANLPTTLFQVYVNPPEPPDAP